MDDVTYNRTLAENIALLRLRGPILEPPTHNVPPAALLATSPGERTLEFEKERDIVDNFAFLSAISDDHERVTAACIEEHPDHQGMTVVLAINEGDLDNVQRGFRSLFRILEEVSMRRNTTQEDDQLKRALLVQVVTLSRPRILSRLRSKHAEESMRNLDKPTIGSFLADAVQIGSRIPSLQTDLAASVIVESKLFLSKFAQLERISAYDSESCSILTDIVESAHRFSKKLRLDEFLNRLPNGPPLHPSGREALLIGMQKIGRYNSASNFFFRAARKLQIFRRLRVEVVRLPEPGAASVNSQLPLPSLMETLQRIDASSRQRMNHVIPSLSEISGSIKRAEKQEFNRFLHRAMNESKIHAEIKILYHYELAPAAISPRIICSSKSACFLCDLFVKVHGKFYVARSHGRLYERWRLPIVHLLGLSNARAETQIEVFKKFNVEIENRIRKILLNQARLRFLHPNESLYVPSPAWTPSGASVVDEDTGSHQGAISDQLSDSDGDIEGSPTQHSGSDEDIEVQQEVVSVPEIAKLSILEPEITLNYPEHLIQGQRILMTRKMTKNGAYFRINKLHLFFDASSSFPEALSVAQISHSGEAIGKPKTEAIEIVWLPEEEAARVRESQHWRIDMVDVSAMREGAEITFKTVLSEASSQVYLCSFKDVIMLSYNSN